MSCKGKPYDLKDLGRTEEQKAMMLELMPIILEGMTRGATPFGGQLSAPPDPSMFNAMNVMSMAGGQGPYQWPGMQTGPYGAPGGGLPGGTNDPYDPAQHPGKGSRTDRDTRTPWWDNPDPYAPPETPPRRKPPSKIK